MLQDLDDVDHGGEVIPSPMLPRTKSRSTSYEAYGPLTPCYVKKYQSPSLIINELESCHETEAFQAFKSNITLYWISRLYGSELPKQKLLHGYFPFILSIGQRPLSSTSIDYCPVISYSINEFETVQEVLKMAEEATLEPGQELVITTFDLGATMKVYQVVWSQPNKYKDHLVCIGSFHTAMNYFHVIGRRCLDLA